MVCTRVVLPADLQAAVLADQKALVAADLAVRQAGFAVFTDATKTIGEATAAMDTWSRAWATRPASSLASSLAQSWASMVSQLGTMIQSPQAAT